MKYYYISEENIEKLENIVSYFRYHNKNLNKIQYNMILEDYDSLQDLTESMRNNFAKEN